MKVPIYGTRTSPEQPLYLVQEGEAALQGDNISSPETMAAFFGQTFDMGHLAEEVFVMAALNTKNEPIGVFCVSHGSRSYALADAGDVFKRVLVCNASRLALAHNHPSGNKFPSSEDFEVTTRMIKAGEILGIEVVDHVIVAREDYYSFRSETSLWKRITGRE